MSKPKALINDNGLGAYNTPKRIFEHEGFEVEMIYDKVDLFALVEMHQPKIVAINPASIYQPEEITAHIQKIHSNTKTKDVVTLLAVSSLTAYESALGDQNNLYIMPKPIDIQIMRDLLQEIKTIINQ